MPINRRAVLRHGLSAGLMLPLLGDPALTVAHQASPEAIPVPASSDTTEWLMSWANPARTSSVAGPGLTTVPVEQWRIPVDITRQPWPGGPLMTTDTLFLWVWKDRRLRAIDLATGTMRWQADVGVATGEGAEMAAALGDGMLYIFGTSADSGSARLSTALFALNTASGRELWRREFSEARFVRPPLVTGSLLVYSSADSTGWSVRAVDTETGQERWHVPLERSVLLGSVVTATNDTIYLATTAPESLDKGRIVAWDIATGTERWRIPASHVSSPGPVVADGVVIAGHLRDDNGQVIFEALDAETGAQQWQHVVDVGPKVEALGINRIAVANGLVYTEVISNMKTRTTLNISSIMAVDVFNGRMQWHALDLEMPVVAGTVLYTSTSLSKVSRNPGHALVALNAVTGDELWQLPGSVQVRVQAAGANLVVVESSEAVIVYGAP